jgi:hypothetical protein
MELNIFFNIMRNKVKNYNEYVIWVFRNIRYIFNSKNKKIHWKCYNKKLKIGILKF